MPRNLSVTVFPHEEGTLQLGQVEGPEAGETAGPPWAQRHHTVIRWG